MTIQAVILAAGESSRFWPLNQKHKSLFKIMGKPLIYYALKNLKRAGIEEIIVVQGIKKDIEKEIKNYYFSNLKIKYVIQKFPRGTGDALKSAENCLKEKVLVLNGDDYYSLEDIKKCLTKFPSILVKKVEQPFLFGTILPEKNFVKKIVERSDHPPSNLVNAGCYFIPRSILKEKIKKSSRGEYEIIDYINVLTQKTKVFFFQAKNWFPLNYPWELLDINEYLLKNLRSNINGKIEKGCYVKPPIIIEKNTILKSNTYIEGPIYIGKNCQIGPNCYIRPFTAIEDNCVIGQGVEIKNSIIGVNSKISHFGYLGDSIIGENCNIGAGAIFANLRLDDKNIYLIVKEKRIDTQRKKLGAILGNNVKIGINSSIMPGVLIGKNSIVGPHSFVKENIRENQIFYTKYQGIFKKLK